MNMPLLGQGHSLPTEGLPTQGHRHLLLHGPARDTAGRQDVLAQALHLTLQLE